METEKIGENRNFEIPKEWIELSQIAHPVFNQVFHYMDLFFSVNSAKDIFFVQKDNNVCAYSLSAFLLKLDPTFQLNQVLGFEEDHSCLEINKLSRLLRSSRIITDFLVYEELLYVILSTNRKNFKNYSFVIDVSNHFYLLCYDDSKIKYRSFLDTQLEIVKSPKSEKEIYYIHYIKILLDLFIYNFFSKIINSLN